MFMHRHDCERKEWKGTNRTARRTVGFINDPVRIPAVVELGRIIFTIRNDRVSGEAIVRVDMLESSRRTSVSTLPKAKWVDGDIGQKTSKVELQGCWSLTLTHRLVHHLAVIPIRGLFVLLWNTILPRRSVLRREVDTFDLLLANRALVGLLRLCPLNNKDKRRVS